MDPRFNYGPPVARLPPLPALFRAIAAGKAPGLIYVSTE